MFEATRLLANPWSARLAEASYVSFRKPLRRIDSTVNFRSAQGV